MLSQSPWRAGSSPFGPPLSFSSPPRLDGKEALFSLVERGAQVRSRHVGDISAKNLRPIPEEQLTDSSKTAFMTDGEGQYRLLADMFATHGVGNHGIGEMCAATFIRIGSKAVSRS